MQILPSALALAKASVWFFDLFALTFWLLFWVLVLHFSLNRKAWSLNNFLRNSKSISNRKAIATSCSDKSKKHTIAGQFYLLRVQGFDGWQSQSQLAVFIYWKCYAPSKDNANTTALNTQLIKTIDEFPTKWWFAFWVETFLWKPEGWPAKPRVFGSYGGARKATKNVWLERGTWAWGERLFYIMLL